MYLSAIAASILTALALFAAPIPSAPSPGPSPTLPSAAYLRPQDAPPSELARRQAQDAAERVVEMSLTGDPEHTPGDVYYAHHGTLYDFIGPIGATHWEDGTYTLDADYAFTDTHGTRHFTAVTR